MGVLACDRNGCKNIMCDRLSENYGYICHECFDELIKSGFSTDIAIFMSSLKTNNREFNEEISRFRYEREFPTMS